MSPETVCTAFACPNTIAWELVKGIPTALATVVIGGTAAYIAWRQYLVAHAKFKLDLFQKRYEIYLATASLLSSMAMFEDLRDLAGARFRGETAAAKFLFDDELADYLDIVANHANVASRTRGNGNTSANWANDELLTLADRFKPYMQMSEWR